LRCSPAHSEDEHDLGSILVSLNELKRERAAGKLFRKSSFARFTFTQKRQCSSLNNYTNFVKDVTPSNIRQFLLIKYLEPIEALGLTPANLPDDFDFLQNGVIDTILGPLSRFVAERGYFTPERFPIQTKQ